MFMKAFFSISIVLLFALQDVNFSPVSTQQEQQVKQILTANPWKQVGFTVSPAITIDEGLGITAKDLHVLQNEDEQNQIIKFDNEGNYKIGSGTSMLSPDMMFASRKVSKKDNTKEDENLNALEDVNELPTVTLLETGSWTMTGENKLVLMADNGRMKEETLTMKNLGHNKIILTFTRIIGGEQHTFTQVLEAQPFIDLGW